jgi:hypothetical protein
MRTLLLLCAPVLALAQGGFTGPGTYEIMNVQSRKVLDLDRNDQTTVIQFGSRNTDNQTWTVEPADSGYFYLRNGMNGNALEVTQNRNSTPVRGAAFNSSPNQQWRIDRAQDGSALIIHRNGKGLDIPDGSDRDGLKVQIYDSNGDHNQRFTFRMVGQANTSRFSRNTSNPNIAAQRLTCSSTSGNRVYCDADTSGNVQMVRQLGGTCQQGSTWGFDQRGIWVDRGCRAEFEITPAAGNRMGRVFRGNNRGGTVTTLICSSESGGRVHCEANTGNGVRLTRQIGGSCQQGSTWGWDATGVWVTQGCRAEFEVSR